jgi:myo-inositol-1(or 4)-monophosphatase
MPDHSTKAAAQAASKTVDHWDLVLYEAIKAARYGREVLISYLGKLKNIEEKFQAGLVSEADRESERVIFDHLRKKFPLDEFIGEESTPDSALPKSPGKSGGRWIVDPLDGTTNYIHQFPIFSVSIGYEFDGEVRVGVIDLPMLGEVYTAIKGRGAFVNGKPLRVSETKELRSAFLGTGFFADNEKILQEQLRIFPDMVRKCRAIRRPGAASYDLALVARGVFDGYYEKGLKPWDAAAGSLLIREAGGVVNTYRGHFYNGYANTCIAANSFLAPQISEVLEPHLDPDSD